MNLKKRGDANNNSNDNSNGNGNIYYCIFISITTTKKAKEFCMLSSMFECLNGSKNLAIVQREEQK